jgi:hypothetical protein
VFISRKKYSPSLERRPSIVPAERVVDRRGRRLLDELLVSPLDRAVALAEVDDVVVSVRQHLHLDVPGVLEVALDVHGRVGEVRLSLPPSRVERPLGLRGRADDLEALPAAPGGGLDGDRPPDLVAEPDHLVRRLDRLGRARDDRHARLLHPLAGGDL